MDITTLRKGYAKGLKSLGPALIDAPTRTTCKDITVAIIKIAIGLADMYNINVKDYIKEA